MLEIYFSRTSAKAKDEVVAPPKKIILNRKVSPAITSPTSDSTILQETDQKNGSSKNGEDATNEEKKVVKLGSLSAEERAKLRAQKFGVAIPDSVKKAVRAERFGNTTSASTTTETQIPTSQVLLPTHFYFQNINLFLIQGGSVDNEKLLKRQARFGVVTVEVDEKKKKRAERFGTATAGSGSTDEQMRKRAERFKLA